MVASVASLQLDRRFIAWALACAALALVAFGLVAAIIPNPLFGRQVPPEPFAYWVWLASAPLLGIVGATYAAPLRPMSPATAVPLTRPEALDERRAGTLGSVAGLGAFLAIGCPVCNKIALVLLGTSGALTIWAPLQPLVGAASLLLLAGTVAWRLRIRRRAGACSA